MCCVRTRQHPLPVWSHKFVLSSTTHISANSHPFLVGIVSLCIRQCCDSHEDNGFAFHWSGQDGHQKFPNNLPVQLGVGAACGLQGIGGQGNRWATNNAVVHMDGSAIISLPVHHH